MFVAIVSGWKYFRALSEHPDADAVIADLEATGSLTPGLNWYRSNVPAASWIEAPIEIPPVAAPTLAMWSDGDLLLNASVQLLDCAWSTWGSRGPGLKSRESGAMRATSTRSVQMSREQCAYRELDSPEAALALSRESTHVPTSRRPAQLESCRPIGSLRLLGLYAS